MTSIRFHQPAVPGRPGSQAGVRTGGAGGVHRGASIMRSPPPPSVSPQPMPGPGLGSLSGSLHDLAGPRFGTQERGSATDAATTLNRNSPGGAPVTDPNALDRFITPENTMRNQRIGFDVREIQPDSQESVFQRMIDAVMPAQMDRFQDQARGIAQRTAALGRTGSGMVDREFADLQNQQERALNSIMGSLAAQASGQDIQNQMTAQGANQQMDMARQAHMFQERGREDQLARQAMHDRAQQMGFLNRGFASDPTSTLLGAGQMGMMGAGEFGANAGMANQALGGLAGSAAQQPGGIGGLVNQLFGGPQLPPMPTPQPPNNGMNLTQVPTQPFDPTQLIR